MMLASTRWRKRAAEYQKQTEECYHEITSKPFIKRVARIQYGNGGSFSYAVWCKPNKQAVNGIRTQVKHKDRGAYRIERMWEVSKEWGVPVERWSRLVMAQAQRDGLSYHYARWLMARGTEASSYA
jgi:hypothetical protein